MVEGRTPAVDNSLSVITGISDAAAATDGVCSRELPAGDSPVSAKDVVEIDWGISREVFKNPVAVSTGISTFNSYDVLGDEESETVLVKDLNSAASSGQIEAREQPGSEEEEENIEVVFDEQEHERTSKPLVVQPLDIMPANNAVLALTAPPETISRSRGRPKGAITKKGRVSDSSIKHRLRRIIKNGMSSNFQNTAGRVAGAVLQGAVLDTPSPVEFLTRVQHAQSGGAILQNFVIHSSTSTDAARSMSAVASTKKKKKWEDMLDEEDDDFLDEEDPLKMFS